MAIVAFHFRESPDPRSLIEWWRLNAGALGADLIVIDISRFKIAEHYSHQNVTVYESLEGVEKDYDDIVYLESSRFLENANIPYIWLHEFKHPESAVYVVGNDHVALQTKGRADRTWVSIKCSPDTHLCADAAAMIALYDRLVKSGGYSN